MINRDSKQVNHSLPGFAPSLAITLFYLSAVVILPLAAIFLSLYSTSWGEVVRVLGEPRLWSAYFVSLQIAFLAALVNVFFGTLVAYALVRCKYFASSVLDALIDLPLALPTAVAGIALTALYAQNGLFGSVLHDLGLESAYSQLGIFLALQFVGFPFVVRALQPVLESFDTELEEAALTAGASRLKVVTHVILPGLVPSLISGFGLAFARGLGEYGSVVFISGNIPHKTEMISVLIMSKLEAHEYIAANLVSVVMLVTSFILMYFVNRIQIRSAER